MRRALAVAALALSMTGCGGSEKDTPERTADAFLVALADGDGDRACGELTSAGRAELEQFLPLFAPTRAHGCVAIVEDVGNDLRDDTFEKAQIRVVRADGDAATVAVRGGPTTVRLVRTDGDWRVESQFRGGWPSFGIPRYPPGASPPPPDRPLP